MQTGAAYIRVSTGEQTEFSPDSQLHHIREYALRHHILLPEEYLFSDEGISGRSAAKRPAFLQMIGLARQKPRPFDVILVWKFSRFARSRQDSIFYKSLLRRECGIDVISITEQLSDDPASILIEALLEAMDEYYSINLAQEVRRGMDEKFSRGGVISSPPFGYHMGTGYFEADEENAAFVRMIFQNFAEGASYRQIADRLNHLGIRSIRGNLFESRTIKYILSNPVYTGKLRRSRDSVGLNGLLTVDGEHEPLIDSQLFQTVQDRISSLEKAHPSHARTEPAAFMLRGLVRCSSCGATLTSSQKGRALQCHRYAKGQCGESHHIQLEKLNRAVLAALSRDLEPRFLQISSETVLSLLSGSRICEAAKNELLRSFISRITFYRSRNAIEICYHL